jgi:hypothetical protein
MLTSTRVGPRASAVLIPRCGAIALLVLYAVAVTPVQAEDGPGRIGAIVAQRTGQGTFECVEFRVTLGGNGLQGLNPFRADQLALDAEFTLPSGKIMRVPGFYSQDYVLRDHRGAAVDGSAGWRVRFSGPEPGRYDFKLELRLKGKLAAVKQGPGFTLKKSAERGMVRISRLAPRYLECDDGSSFFAIGQNVCFTTDVMKDCPGTRMTCPTLPWDVAYARWFGRMGQNGANWARLFMKPLFYLEPGQPWDWSLENAWRLDQVLELARANRLRICLCFNAERTDRGETYGGSWDLLAASTTAWGRLLGPSGFRQFAADPRCREMYCDKIRYIVGRWGYSPNIFSWELWNEIECTPAGDMRSWSREMTAYLRAVDPWRHLVKSSGASHLPQGYWGVEQGDLNDVHPYFGWSGEEEPKNLGWFLPKFSSALRATGRPFLIGETGLAREVKIKQGQVADLADKDTTCFHLHEALWGGLFSGAVGTGMVWFWDVHVDRLDAYHHFRSLANFVDDIAFNQEEFTPAHTAAASPSDLQVFELAGKRTRLFWIRHHDMSWYNLAVEGKSPPLVERGKLILPGLPPGRYRVEYWDTEEGKRFRTEELTASNDRPAVSLPDFRGELAMKLRKAE